MLRKNTIILSIVAIISIAFSVYVSAPELAGIYIKHKYPFVHFSEASVSWTNQTVTLTDVRIEKDNIKIKSPLVHANKKSVYFSGGEAQIDVIESTSSTKLQSYYTQIISGYLEYIEIRYKNKKAKLRYAKFDDIKKEIDVLSGNVEGLVLDSNTLDIQFKSAKIYPNSKKALFQNIIVYHPFVTVIASNISGNLNEKEILAEKIDVTKGGENFITFNNVRFIPNEDKISVWAETTTTNHPKLFSSNLTYKDISASYNIPSQTITIQTNFITIDVSLKNKTISGKSSCQNWIDAMPKEMKKGNPLENSPKLDGEIDFNVIVDKDNPTFKFKYTCSLASPCSELTYITALKKRFVYQVYDGNGTRIERESGPGTKEWVHREAVSEHMIRAVVFREDPGFFFNKGIEIDALRNSFIDNIKTGKIIRGGSTITMQMIKNIWLSRDKTAGRKVQEILLAPIVSKCLTKNEIITLYLNVIEYGKDCYGIANGADRYFKKSPIELDPVESFYLAAVLPAPKKAQLPNEQSLRSTEDFMLKIIGNTKEEDTIDLSELELQ